jgi:hypothetical protein
VSTTELLSTSDKVGALELSGVQVMSEVGCECAVFSPWTSAQRTAVQVSQIGATGKVTPVPIQWSAVSGPGTVPAGAIFRFNTTAGSTYHISASANASGS